MLREELFSVPVPHATPSPLPALDSGRYIVRFSIRRLQVFYLFLILPNGDLGIPTPAGNYPCSGIEWIVSESKSCDKERRNKRKLIRILKKRKASLEAKPSLNNNCIIFINHHPCPELGQGWIPIQ